MHQRARELRAQGRTYNEIPAELGVSKGSISLWVRDLPSRDRLSYEECRRRNAAATTAYFDARRKVREAEYLSLVRSATAQIGQLSAREILIAGSIAYWCEGSKNKPYRRPANRVVFINSDPGLVLFFLRFLDVAGIARDRIICRVHIHESADAEAAQRYWLEVTGLPMDQFRRPILKLHNPKTVRKNTGASYHGCLRIEVRRGVAIYLKIEGWVAAAITG